MLKFLKNISCSFLFYYGTRILESLINLVKHAYETCIFNPIKLLSERIRANWKYKIFFDGYRLVRYFLFP